MRSSAQHQLYIILEVFRYFGITIAEDKFEGPNQNLIFPGIELDTLHLEARLPDDKLAELKQRLRNLLQSGHPTAGSLDKSLFKLSFASPVELSGHLWELKSRCHNSKLYFKLKIPDDCRRDLLWWQVLLQKWNGCSVFLNTELTSATDLGIFTDAVALGGERTLVTNIGGCMAFSLQDFNLTPLN